MSKREAEGTAASSVARRRPDEVRERVLEAARVCFRRNGALRTRMDDVADQAGLQRPNLYRYFANRDALITAVIVREIALTNAVRQERIPLTGPVSAILVESLTLGSALARSDEMTQFLLVAEMREETSAIVTAEQAIMNAECSYWYPILAYGRSRSEINPAMSDVRIVRWLLTMQVFVSTQPDVETSLAANARQFYEEFVVPPALNLGAV